MNKQNKIQYLKPMRNCYNTNDELVNSLNTSEKVKNIMKKIDRGFFCVNKEICYCDKPSGIDMKQTISAPHMHAKAIEYLQDVLKPGANVLDVGSGSGYLTACFAEAVKVYNKNSKLRGKVFGLEIHKELVEYSKKIISNNYNYLEIYDNHFGIYQGSGWDGLKKKNIKFNAIHVGATADSLPIPLINSLKIGGVLIIPLQVKKDLQIFCRITRMKNNLKLEMKENVRYVSLVKKI